MYISGTQRRRGLGRLGSQAMPLSLATVTAPPDPADCWPYYFFGKGSYDACVNRLSTAQIQTVLQNAVAAGYPSDVVAVAQAAADAAAAQVPQDTQTIDTSYALPSSPFQPSLGPSFSWTDPTTWPVWLWIALGGGTLVAVKLLK